MAVSLPSTAGAEGLIDLGLMNGFYRYTAVLGPQLAADAESRVSPAWMLQTDFPYQRRSSTKEIPFADGLSLVRLLGGWKDAALPSDRHSDVNDLAYRDAAGAVQYRWDLLKARLDPYVHAGYSDLTLVLDNVPYCFPAKPTEGDPPSSFGQAAPPADWNEWRSFIHALCRQLVSLYGMDTVKHFRFRMGTEMQSRSRFDGTREQYEKYYDYAAAGVREEIPEAAIGPFNQAGLSDENGPSLITVAQHCALGKNWATGLTGSPLNFLPRSYYYFAKEPQPGVFANIQPDSRVPEMAKTWSDAVGQSSRFLGVGREVQEFGPSLGTEGGIRGRDTGARGAAQTFDTLLALKLAGTDRVWHWDLFENLDADKSLLYSQGWLYSIFDSMRGGKLYAVPVKISGNHSNRVKAMVSVLKDKAILVVACWNVDRTVKTPQPVTLRLPKDLLDVDSGRVKFVSLTEETAVYDVVRKDLLAAGQLSPKHVQQRGNPATELMGHPGQDQMALSHAEGRAFGLKNWDRYQKLMSDSLTLSGFQGDFAQAKDGASLSFSAANPSVTVIVLPKPVST